MTLTTLSCAPQAEDTSVVAQVALLVRELAQLAGTGCLVEGPDGALITHYLVCHDVPPTVVRSLVTGQLRPLHETLCQRRATGCLPSGPVVEGLLGEDGPAVAHLVLREGIGTVWLLLDEGDALRLEHVADTAERLRVVLAATWQGMVGSSLRAWLDGVPGVELPEPLRSSSRLWLVGTPDASAVSRGLPRHLPALASGAYVLVGGSAATRSVQVAAAVERALPDGRGAVSVELTGDVDVAAARAALDVASDAAPAGRCVPLGDVRGAVVARCVGEALDSLPDLGADPLALLEAYDERRGSSLVCTLRAWLDGFGDAPTVAQSLGVHANTLRYRLGRIQEITGVDLRHDPIGRLELHVRLVVHPARGPR
jgi:hypothetical protein